MLLQEAPRSHQHEIQKSHEAIKYNSTHTTDDDCSKALVIQLYMDGLTQVHN